MFFKKSKRRAVVVSLDGVPYTFLQFAFKGGIMPFLSSLAKSGSFVRMNSVYPTISSVAWSTFTTGVNPAKHRIFGFVDRNPNPFKIFIPTGRHRGIETIPEKLSKLGKKVFYMNVPVTYPPFEVKGILVSGFLATNIEKATYPVDVARTLKEMGYVIDVDPWKAKENRDQFLADLYNALKARFRAARYYYREEDWDFFMVHIMETDRINHFFWPEGNGNYSQKILDFYREVDREFERFAEILDSNVLLFSLSDHGFCSIKKEIFLNHWLHKEGYLKFKNTPPKDFSDIDPKSVAYSLIPGRVYINLKGREEFGSVEPGEPYERLREEIKESLLALKDPDTGEKIIERVFKREEIYHGPYLEEASDLIAHPKDGYDLKGNLFTDSLVGRSHLVGMHTYDDAYFIIPQKEVAPHSDFSIVDVPATILNLLKIKIEGLDGKVIH